MKYILQSLPKPSASASKELYFEFSGPSKFPYINFSPYFGVYHTLGNKDGDKFIMKCKLVNDNNLYPRIRVTAGSALLRKKLFHNRNLLNIKTEVTIIDNYNWGLTDTTPVPFSLKRIRQVWLIDLLDAAKFSEIKGFVPSIIPTQPSDFITSITMSTVNTVE